MAEAVKSPTSVVPLAQTLQPRRSEGLSPAHMPSDPKDDGAFTSSLGNTSNNPVSNEPSFCHCYCGSKEEEEGIFITSW